MLIIKYPSTFKPERNYVHDIVFSEYLGIQSKIKYHNEKNIIIEVNNKKIIIRDAFFSDIDEKKMYLKKEHLPKSITKTKDPFIPSGNLITMYGKNQILIEENTIRCQLDIFASIFFMLTRWEEYVIKERDNHNRFDSKYSLAVKYKFFDRPIVNEYMELIWNMLKHFGFNEKRKKRTFQLYHSHDIDEIKYWKTPYHYLKYLAKYSFKYQSFNTILKSIYKYPISLFNANSDPWYSFDFLMDLSELANTKSHFYFMAGGKTEYDNRYKITNPLLKKTLKHIHNRGHIIGFHPSYNTYNNINLFQDELNKLQSVSPQEIKYGRQHYLRFEVPTTWQIWNESKLQLNSTCGYENILGFRTGTCFTYSTFNCLTRQKLNLKETPLHIMDETIFRCFKNKLSHTSELINSILNNVKKYNGNIGFLWHNNNLNIPEWYQHQNLFVNTIIKSCN